VHGLLGLCLEQVLHVLVMLRLCVPCQLLVVSLLIVKVLPEISKFLLKLLFLISCLLYEGIARRWASRYCVFEPCDSWVEQIIDVINIATLVDYRPRWRGHRRRKIRLRSRSNRQSSDLMQNAISPHHVELVRIRSLHAKQLTVCSQAPNEYHTSATTHTQTNK
jgi:hypothetical protein